MRAFTQLRKMLSTDVEIKKIKNKIVSMEKKYDKQFGIVFEAINQLLDTKKVPKKKIGFDIADKKKKRK